MVILSNFTYHSPNIHAEDTTLNLEHYMDKLKLHFLSPDRVFLKRGLGYSMKIDNKISTML